MEKIQDEVATLKQTCIIKNKKYKNNEDFIDWLDKLEHKLNFLLKCLETKNECPVVFSQNCEFTIYGSMTLSLNIQYFYNKEIKSINFYSSIENPTIITNTKNQFVFKSKDNRYFLVDKAQGVCNEIPKIDYKDNKKSSLK